MEIIRKIFLALGLLIVFTLAGLLTLFVILTNPENLKKRITTEIYAQTGLQVQIKGKVQWRMSPALEINMNDIQFTSGNAKELNVELALRPLLARQAKIQRIELKQFSIIVNSLLPPIGDLPITVTGDAEVNLPQQTLKIPSLKIKRGDIQASGQVFATHIFQKPVFTGQLNSEKISLTPELQVLKAAVHFNFSADSGISGKLSSDQLSLGRIQINHLTTQFNYQNKQLQLKNINGVIASGVLNGQGVIDNLITAPRYEFNATLKHVELSQLLQSGILQGPADLTTQLKTQGVTSAAALANLNGSLKIIAFDGSLNHIDLLKQIHVARQFLEINPVSQSESLTHFSYLSTSGIINNGIFSSDDFLLQAENLKASGGGTVNLINKEINYQVLVKAKGKLLNQDYGLSAPLKISGKLNKPKVKIDLHRLNFSAKPTPDLGKQAGKVIHDEIKLLFGAKSSNSSL